MKYLLEKQLSSRGYYVYSVVLIGLPRRGWGGDRRRQGIEQQGVEVPRDGTEELSRDGDTWLRCQETARIKISNARQDRDTKERS